MVDLRIILPDGFLDEEVRCGYAVTKNMKEVWAVELDLLYVLDCVCKKYNIKYWADGGTMLGAIRHKGFIPWDDDIDIIMTRDNYDRLCEVGKKEFTEPYFFQTEYTDPGSLRGHAQLRNSNTSGILESEYKYSYSFNQGIFIDIFPLDFIPDNEDEKRIYIKKVESLMKRAQRTAIFQNRYIPYRRNFLKKMLNFTVIKFIHFFNRKKKEINPYFIEFEDTVKANNSTKTNTLGKLFFCPINEKSIWRSEWFKETIYVPFEMLTIPVSAEYDMIMTKFFGDWRTPSHNSNAHGNVLFDADKPYSFYIKHGYALEK